MDAAPRVASSSAVHPVRVRGVAARGSEDNGGSATPDGDVAERRCCSKKLGGSHAVVPPPVHQHQHDRNAGGDQGALLGEQQAFTLIPVLGTR
jgi:hypothetical protein